MTPIHCSPSVYKFDTKYSTTCPYSDDGVDARTGTDSGDVHVRRGCRGGRDDTCAVGGDGGVARGSCGCRVVTNRIKVAQNRLLQKG